MRKALFAALVALSVLSAIGMVCFHVKGLPYCGKREDKAESPVSSAGQRLTAQVRTMYYRGWNGKCYAAVSRTDPIRGMRFESVYRLRGDGSLDPTPLEQSSQPY
jgi:hypothetical protein